MTTARAMELEAPASQVTRIEAGEVVPMTRRLWNLDWSTILPWDVEGVQVSYETLGEVSSFIAAHYPRIFNTRGTFYVEEMTDAKRRFLEEMDIFVFRSKGEIVGILGGHPSDWSTYYWRTVAFLPEFRGQGLVGAFAERTYEYFKGAGVQRMDVDTCPGNRATVRLFTSQGFVTSSMLASERWGLSIRFTKFLDGDPEEVFRRQFLDIPV